MRDIDGLAQDYINSIANALELRLSNTQPSIWEEYLVLYTKNGPAPCVAHSLTLYGD